MIEGKYWYIVNLKMCLCQEDREQSKTRFYDFNPIMSTVFNRKMFIFLFLRMFLILLLLAFG